MSAQWTELEIVPGTVLLWLREGETLDFHGRGRLKDYSIVPTERWRGVSELAAENAATLARMVIGKAGRPVRLSRLDRIAGWGSWALAVAPLFWLLTWKLL